MKTGFNLRLSLWHFTAGSHRSGSDSGSDIGRRKKKIISSGSEDEGESQGRQAQSSGSQSANQSSP